MNSKGVDQINLYKLMRYLRETKLARKVESYSSYAQQQSGLDTIASSQAQQAKFNEEGGHCNSKDVNSSGPGSSPTLTHVQNFMHALTYPSQEGRFFYSKSDHGGIQLEYMLLDPTHPFQEVVNEARAVILAGGTMSPMSDYVSHLFPYLPPDRIRTLSCGHVVPATSLFASPIATGPNGLVFDFTYSNRTSYAMIEQLGQALVVLASIIPDGVVVFFPSYAYLDLVVSRWQATSTYSNLTKHKPLYRESSAPVEETLDQYSASIHQGHGALLLSVVGGKLSEGINFSDSLGRGIVIVGLPYPNPNSAHWKAKSSYIINKTVEAETTRGVGVKEARAIGESQAREFYENKCLRAVNQSIGRAIRHRGDWAGIFLVDRRYAGERVSAKLPGWIRQSVRPGSGGFAELERGMREFYGRKRTSQS